MNFVELRTSRFVSLVENAAWRLGYAACEDLGRRKGAFHPGDPIGNLLCESWLLDPHFASRAFVEYMGGLREAALNQGSRAPSVSEVLAGLPLAVNSARYPEVKKDHLIDHISTTIGDISPAL